MGGKIPESVLKRPKQAYRAPISSSFLGDNKPEYLKDLLSESTLKKYCLFDPQRVQSLIEKLELSASAETENMALAAIISSQLLVEMFLINKPLLNTDMSDCKIIRQDSYTN
jgi:asparagine synthase (glutamine-hydrolysing)